VSRTNRAWIGTTALAIALAATGARAESPAAKVIARLNGVLLDVLKNAATLGYAGRVERLTPAVTAAYDVPFMAEKSLGPHWAELSEAQRQRWIDLSRRFSVANYAANFDHWSNQTIDIVGEEPSANDTTIVRTKLVDPAGEGVEMSYRLRSTPEGWKIVDVLLKGTVSELALRRSDYTAVLEQQGFDALATSMERKIADLASGKTKR